MSDQFDDTGSVAPYGPSGTFHVPVGSDRNGWAPFGWSSHRAERRTIEVDCTANDGGPNGSVAEVSITAVTVDALN